MPTPFPQVPLVEAVYWHHNRHADPAHRGPRETVRTVGASLDEPLPVPLGPAHGGVKAITNALDQA
ncbi:hypothetical protein [Streptomyces sp. NPDC052107]|uniref:hypothetical protein n=1 Tax=Streptomyces sp. NPDC052107 TaxID=3155632 RepID=UPI003432AF37